jgi:hypothetical protein
LAQSNKAILLRTLQIGCNSFFPLLSLWATAGTKKHDFASFQGVPLFDNGLQPHYHVIVAKKGQRFNISCYPSFKTAIHKHAKGSLGGKVTSRLVFRFRIPASMPST